MRYEYKTYVELGVPMGLDELTIVKNIASRRPMVDILNEFGQEGWELVSVTSDGGCRTAYFKRELVDD